MGSLVRERIANDMRDQLEQYGIDVTVPPDWGFGTSITERIYNHTYDVLLLGISGRGGDPFGYLTAVLGSESIEPGNSLIGIDSEGQWVWEKDLDGRGLNVFSYWNPTLDSIIAQAKQETSISIQHLLCDQAQEIVVEDVPAIWLYDVTNIRGISTRIIGFAGGSPWWPFADGPLGWIEIADYHPPTYVTSPVTTTPPSTTPILTTPPGDHYPTNPSTTTGQPETTQGSEGTQPPQDRIGDMIGVLSIGLVGISVGSIAGISLGIILAILAPLRRYL